ncbi:MAG: hypothetical protein L0229_19770 [Blastocatellia bacterium]|nr:hypothetical protein [Blastocatellia bacterium]
MKHLLWVVGLVALGPGIWFLVKFSQSGDVDTGGETTNLIYAGIFLVIALICFGVFFYMRFKEEGDQDISITRL